MLPSSDRPQVLILGGSGFLGKHLVDLLVGQQWPVRVYMRGTHDEVLPAGVEAVHGDFATGERLAEALDGVDVVYHLLSTSTPGESNADPLGDVNSNLVATLRLLELMKAAGVKRIVYASSGGTVYGNPDVLPVPETHPLRPISSYGIVKAAVEHYLALYAQRDGLVANVLRISNPYGPYQNHLGTQGVIATFLHRLMQREPIEIWGDGSAVRDYVYVPDVARALWLAGQRPQSGTFNIGSGVGHSINDVVRILQEQTGLTGTIRYLPRQAFAVQRTYLDIGRARAELGWSPQYTLETGCASYYQALCRTPQMVT
jgi:UDP-glucose 4-epimerase